MAEVEGQFAGVEVILQQPNTRAFEDGKALGTGSLSVEESNLYWSSSDGSARLVLHYPSIAIHAVSRDTSVFPHQCVYLQCLRQRNTAEEGEEEGGGQEEEEEEEEEEVVEVRFVPPSSEHLEAIYQAITHCQTLYPDPELSDSEEGDEGEWEGEEGEGQEGEIDLQSGEFFTAAEGLDHLSPQGLATLSHLERILQLPSPAEFDGMISNGDGTGTGTQKQSPDQFEDAD